MSPLLRFGEEGDNGGGDDFAPLLNGASNSHLIMETSTGAEEEFGSRMMMVQHPGARRLMFRFAQIHTLADCLPSFAQMITTSGKLSGVAFLGIYFAFILLWLPFWLLSFFVTEFGVYAISVATIFYLGRAIIRMIAFPGASSKVVQEVEIEFAKYSVRMLVAAANCLRELAQAVVATGESGTTATSRGNGGSISYYDIQPLWKRAKSYRDRALGVFLDVLTYIYEHPQQVPTQPDNQRTRFGTNRMVGDIGNLNGLTVSLLFG